MATRTLSVQEISQIQAQVPLILYRKQLLILAFLTHSTILIPYTSLWAGEEKYRFWERVHILSMNRGLLFMHDYKIETRDFFAIEQRRMWLLRVRIMRSRVGLQDSWQLSTCFVYYFRGTGKSFIIRPVYRFYWIMRRRFLKCTKENKEIVLGWNVKLMQVDSRTYLHYIFYIYHYYNTNRNTTIASLSIQQFNLKQQQFHSAMSASRIKVESYQFNPRQYVTHYANQRQVLIWKQIFDTFDTDQDGVLAPRDLLQAMSKYNGYHPKRNYIYHTISLFDKDQSGNIDFREFLRMVHEKPYEKDTKEDMQRVFNDVDQELKGYIDEDDLRNMASELKEELSEQEIKIIMAKLDPKKTGKISLQAFMQFNRQKIY